MGDDSDGTDGKKVYYSHRVLFATVLELVADPVFKRPGVEAASLDIICIYKGGQLPQKIKVVGTGNANGEIHGCPAVTLEVGQSYVFFLNDKTDRFYEVEFAPLSGDPTIILDDLTIHCGLTREFPTGLPVNEECYETMDNATCERHIPPTSTTSTTTAAPNPPKENGTKKVNPGENGGYETNTSKGGKAVGSKDDKDNNSSGILLVSWTLFSLSLILALL